MLGFLFSMESLALSLGCDRTQLELAVAQSHPEDPAKIALLWAARVQLGQMSRADLRARCDELLASPLLVPAYPRYLSGFVHALEPVPSLAGFVVEAVSNAFGRLPDPVLLPWLPTLITTLRSGGAELAPLLIREAGRIFPGRLAALDAWVPPWRAQPAGETKAPSQSPAGVSRYSPPTPPRPSPWGTCLRPSAKRLEPPSPGAESSAPGTGWIRSGQDASARRRAWPKRSQRGSAGTLTTAQIKTSGGSRASPSSPRSRPARRSAGPASSKGGT